MKKILVTGVNGFVGRHLALELSRHDYAVAGIGGQVNTGNPVTDLVSYEILDLTDKLASAAIDFTDVVGVIHLAGLAAVGPSFDDPMGYITANVGMECNLFEAALAQHASPRFVIISSGSLYDPKAPLPLSEQSTVFPSSPYAVSKLGQEQLANYYGGRGFDCIIARPFNHCGPGQGLGFIVPDLTKQAVDFEKGKATEILVGNLDAQRDYTDVRDIARAYRLLLEKGRAGNTYNICSDTPLSGHQILDHIMENVGTRPPIKQDPSKMRPSDTPIIYGNHQKLTDDTGWQPEISIETTIVDVVTDWRNRL